MSVFDALVSALIKKGYHIAAAESCTGGMFASEIVSIPDASRVLSASFVTYSEKAKQKFAFVPEHTLEEYGVVSEETALAMARGAAENAEAQVGVGITGYAGPSGGDAFAEKGTVCFGFVTPDEEKSIRVPYKELSRNEIRKNSVIFAAEKLTEMLEK